MKILATIHQTYETDWRIKITPRKRRDGTYESSAVSFWSPEHTDETMLIYNPIISIVMRNRFDKSAVITIPINQVYALEDALSVAYNNLNTKGLYTTDGQKLYIDAKIADKTAIKLTCFRDVIILYPIIMYLPSGEELKGIRFVSNGKPVADMRHVDIRELCEKLNHMDLQTFSIIASMLEKMGEMDQKLDRILETQAEILQLLKSEGFSVKRNKPLNPMEFQAGGLNWQRVQ